MTGIEVLEQVRPRARAPSCCCSRRTPTPTWRSRRSTRSGSTTTCSSRGTRRRSGSTRSSTTCSRTGSRSTPTGPRGAGGRPPLVGPQLRDQDLPGPQPRAVPLARRRARRRGRPARRARRGGPERPAAGAGARRRGAARALHAGAGRRARAADPRRAAALRPVHRRRRTGRAGRRGLRRVRGPAHRGRRARRARRPGRPERVDRELPRLPQGPVRCGPDPPGGRAGVPVRRRDGAGPRTSSGSRPAGRCGRSCSTGGGEIEARAVLVATGVSYRRLEAPGLEELVGSRASTTAPRRARRRSAAGEDVYVVGAANSAGQAVAQPRPLRQAGRDAGPRRRGSRTPCRSTSSHRIRAAPTTSRCGCRTEVVGRVGRRPPRGADAVRPRHRQHARRWRPAGCSSSSAPRPAPTGSATPCVRDGKGFVVTGQDRCWPAQAGLAAGAAAVRPGDQRARRLRRRGRPAGLDEAGGLGRRRGRDVGLPRPPLPGDDMMRRSPSCGRSPLFDGLDDDAAGRAGAARRGASLRARRGAVPRGAAGRRLVGAARRGSIELVRRVGGEDDRAGGDDRARAVGRRVPAPGTSTASTSPPAGRRRRAGCCASRPTALRTLRRRVVPVRRPLHQGARRHRAPDRVDRAAARGAGRARHPGGRAGPRDQQPGLGGDPRGRRPGRPTDALLGVAAPARRARHHRRAVRRAGRPAARGRAPPGPAADAAGRRGPRGGAVRLAGAPRRRPGLAGGARRWPPPASTSRGASGSQTCSATGRSGPGLEWVANSLAVGGLLAEVKESTRRVSDLVGGGALLLPARPRLGAAHRRHRGAGEHPGGARPQARGRSPSCATTPTTCRRSRPCPASSTRCGPTSSTTPSTPWTARARSRVATARRRLGGVVVEIADTGPGMPAEVAGARLRAVLHHQGRRPGHRPGPRHLPADRRRAALRATSRSSRRPVGRCCGWRCRCVAPGAEAPAR